MSDERRVRWRITLDELCHKAKATPQALDHWAEIGALGPRWRENRDRGKWRHITREVAQRAVIMSHLLQAGIDKQVAAKLAATHERGDDTPLIAKNKSVQIIVWRSNIKLP